MHASLTWNITERVEAFNKTNKIRSDTVKDTNDFPLADSNEQRVTRLEISYLNYPA